MSLAPAREDVRQAAYAEYRRAWRQAYLDWIALQRPGSFLAPVKPA